MKILLTALTMKMCKDCGENKRYANTSRCYQCLRIREKAKKETKAKRKLERKLSSKKYLKSLYRILHNKAWKVFSEYVRRVGVNFQGMTQCFTCQKQFSWQELHAGHRWHNKLNFDRRNINPQCPKCNTYLHGNLGSYERRIIENYGIDFAKKLEQEAHQHKGYSVKELQEIIEKYTELLKTL